jgi:FAD/FMN-containing dehydrogenase
MTVCLKVVDEPHAPDHTVGAEKVLTAADSDVCVPYGDWRGRYHGAALCVVRPATTAAVAAVVRACAEAGVAMVPQGGNTSLCGAATPACDGRSVVISLSRMNRVRAIDPANNTITVEAGCVLQTVQEAAAEAVACFRCHSPPRAVARSAAICRPMPAACRCCATATRAS